MDILSIVTDLLGSNIINTVAKQTGEKKNDISNVLQTALPDLVGKLTNTKTSTNKVSKNDDSLLTSLLGSNTSNFLDGISKKLGLSTTQITSILVAALPLIIEKISDLTSTDTKKKTTKKTSTKSSKKKKTNDDLDLGSIASTLIKGATSSKKKNNSDDILGSIVSNLFKGK